MCDVPDVPSVSALIGTKELGGMMGACAVLSASCALRIWCGHSVFSGAIILADAFALFSLFWVSVKSKSREALDAPFHYTKCS